MTLTLRIATEADAGVVAALHNRTADGLTASYGHGYWSAQFTERMQAWHIRSSRVLLYEDAGELIATLRLATKKPWAIDVSYFTAVKRPLYLLNMAVVPERQRQGIGRRLLDEAEAAAREWPVQALRLDAYDADAGAGGFYERCGYREMGRVVYRDVPLIYYELLL